MRITEQDIKDAEPGTTLREGALEIWVGQRKRTWWLRHGKSRQRTKLGHHPELSVRDARLLAGQKLAEITRSPSLAPTVKELVDRWEAEYARPRSLASAKWTLKRLRSYAVPSLGSIRADRVTRAQVQRLVDDLHEKPNTAHKLAAELKRVFKWAVRRGYLEHSPIDAVEMPRAPSARRRVLSPQEVVATLDKLAEPQRSYFEILLLTGQRPGEIMEMRWSDIEGDTWNMPAELAEAKKKARTGESRRVPLSGAVQQILARQPRVDDRVFPFSSKEAYTRNLHKARKKAGLRHFHRHDWRRTAATVLQELGVQPHVIERLQGREVRIGAERSYQHYDYFPEQRDAVEALARWVAQLPRSTPPEPTS